MADDVARLKQIAEGKRLACDKACADAIKAYADYLAAQHNLEVAQRTLFVPAQPKKGAQKVKP